MDAPTRPASSTIIIESPEVVGASQQSGSLSLSSSEASLVSSTPTFCDDDDPGADAEKPPGVMENPEVNEVKVVFVKYPDECCPVSCTKHSQRCCQLLDKSLLGRAWWMYRCGMYRLVENKYFESFIIIMILASSLALVSINILLDFITIFQWHHWHSSTLRLSCMH